MNYSSQRQPTKRVLIAELLETTHAVSDNPDDITRYLIPSGELAYRVLIGGTLTELGHDMTSDDVQMYRARIGDGTNDITFTARKDFDPEVYSKMKEIDESSNSIPPAFALVKGRVDTFSNDEGEVFVALNPEEFQIVDRDARNMWVADTLHATLERIETPPEASDAVALADDVYGGSGLDWLTDSGIENLRNAIE